jgi:CelD/BcsL family acetyltransferase involved in cellulose biosynthesis
MGAEGVPRRIRAVDGVDVREWEGLLGEDPRAMPFHHPRWIRRYAAHHPGKQARWLEARDGTGRLLAGLPFVVSARAGLRAVASGVAGTYGGPVTRPGADAAEARILEHYLRHGRPRTILREMLWGREEPPTGGGGVLRPIEAAVVDVRGGFETFWSHVLPMNRRNEYNRSERRGTSADESRRGEDLEAFHPLYRERAVRWRGPVHSLAFLRAVLEEEPACFLNVVRHDGLVVGGHLCFETPGEILAWLGASEHRRDIFPATVVVVADARAAARRGLARVNLGSSLGLQGVAHFKRLCGAESSRRWLLHREAGWLRRLRGRSA